MVHLGDFLIREFIFSGLKPVQAQQPMFGSVYPEAKWRLAAPQLDTRWKGMSSCENMGCYSKLQPVAKVLTMFLTLGGEEAGLG